MLGAILEPGTDTASGWLKVCQVGRIDYTLGTDGAQSGDRSLLVGGSTEQLRLESRPRFSKSRIKAKNSSLSVVPCVRVCWEEESQCGFCRKSDMTRKRKGVHNGVEVARWPLGSLSKGGNSMWLNGLGPNPGGVRPDGR